jgi:hypothetical protein
MVNSMAVITAQIVAATACVTVAPNDQITAAQ